MSLANPIAVPALSRRRFLFLSASAAMGAVSAGGVLAVVSPGRAAAVAPKEVTAASGAFLDALIVHEIAVTFDQSAYDAMLETYSSTGDKEWIEATVSIDGSTYEKAGMRLKGNSSLGGRIVGPDADQGTPAAGPDQSGPAAGSEPPDGEGFVDQQDGGTDFDVPQRLPWLIRLDKFVDGQRHEGIKELVIRSNRSQTSLNEAVALDLIADAGLASQLAAATGFSVNGSDPVLRLAVEHPNEDWMALRFSGDGLLYKGESTGDYSYRGDDPEAYDEVFDLEAGGSGDDAEDMKPLIDFLDFLNNSDDETFANEIEERLDVAQFAVYNATMVLIGNFDDLAGPGNNGYLYLDRASGQFTVVPWDMNLAFGGLGGVISGAPPELPDGADPPSSSSGPNDGTPVAGEGRPGGGPTIRIGGPNGEGSRLPNPLVDRFKGIETYAAMIEDASNRLRADLYESGAANDVLSRWVEVLKKGAAAMVDQATITSEAEAIATSFTQT